MTTQGNSTANGLLTKNQPQPAHLGFIGGGNMAASLISGLVADDYSPAHIIVSDPEAEKRATLSARFGVRSARDNLEAARQAEVLILAVKPQVLQATCHDLRQVVQARRPLIMSVAAGVREQYLQQWLGGGLPLVRTMPNTPAMIQAGATVLHADAGVSVQQCNLAESIMRAVGLTLWVTHEDQMDAVTALSGSGPAYFFLVMEALQAAGCELGLPPQTARLLTLQTAFGAAKMALESSEDAATLRARVTSPGGTTERAIQSFQADGLEALVRKALQAAAKRSSELGNELGK